MWRKTVWLIAILTLSIFVAPVAERGLGAEPWKAISSGHGVCPPAQSSPA